MLLRFDFQAVSSVTMAQGGACLGKAGIKVLLALCRFTPKCPPVVFISTYGFCLAKGVEVILATIVFVSVGNISFDAFKALFRCNCCNFL